MRRALLAFLLGLGTACGSVGGNPDGSMPLTCKTTADCPLPDAGGCDATCTYPENQYFCNGSGLCCCACACAM
jgi:hypothetical protein